MFIIYTYIYLKVCILLSYHNEFVPYVDEQEASVATLLELEDEEVV